MSSTNKPETSEEHEATTGAADAAVDNHDAGAVEVVEDAPDAEAASGESDDNQELLKALDAATAEATEMKERYLRAVAELDTFRRRIAREKQDIIRTASCSVVEALLPVLDNMGLGLESASRHPEAAEVTKGFAMVFDQLKSILREQGLESLEPVDVAFDPNLHEAIAQQPSSEISEGNVLQTVRTGYRLNERLLRAASVVVSSGPAED